jgi:hypothetical protein
MVHYSPEVISNILSAFASISVGIVVAFISYKYNKNSTRIEQDRFSRELFMEFNRRYDKINDSLHLISLHCKNLNDLKNNPKLESKLIDFFNLCAEEYYWYKKGRIDEFLWQAWQEGMNHWYINVPLIKEAWEEEIKLKGLKSYYINQKNDFFKDL